MSSSHMIEGNQQSGPSHRLFPHASTFPHHFPAWECTWSSYWWWHCADKSFEPRIWYSNLLCSCPAACRCLGIVCWAKLLDPEAEPANCSQQSAWLACWFQEWVIEWANRSESAFPVSQKAAQDLRTLIS